MLARTVTVLAGLGVLIASATVASAHDTRLYDIDARQHNQREAIEAGRRDGSLTWFERYRLNRQQARIAELERMALSDGRLTREEAGLIRQAQDDAARHIGRERHDMDVRGGWWRLWR